MRRACDVTKGDLLVTSGVHVESVMVEGDTTYVSWGERRLVDTFHKGDVVLDIYPSKCPNCGYQLVRPGDE